MAENKIISYDVELLSTDKRLVYDIPEIFTNDLLTNEFQFNILDMTSQDLTGATGDILLTMRDGSHFKNEGQATRTGTTFKYIIKENEGNHYGLAEIQLVVNIGGKRYATPLYKFAIMQGLDDKMASEVVIKDLNSETRQEIASLKIKWQQVINETTGKDIVSAPEIIAARKGKDNLATRLDDFESETISKLAKASTDSVSLSKLTGDINGYIGHRGYSNIAPENTLSAYLESYKHGHKIVETDVRRTVDGVWILMHDDTVDRTTDGTGMVSNMTLSQVKALTVDFKNAWAFAEKASYYDNAKVPTLDEFLKLCKKYRLIPQIEVQGSTNINRDINEIVNLLKKNRLEYNSCVITAQVDIIEKIRELDDKIYCMIVGVGLTEDIVNKAKSIKNCGVVVNQGYILSSEQLNYAHDQGVEVSCYTVNDMWRAEELFSYGIDFIATDVLTRKVAF